MSTKKIAPEPPPRRRRPLALRARVDAAMLAARRHLDGVTRAVRQAERAADALAKLAGLAP